ncbi:hypothetical protein [Blastopirellula retiformator]|uniref:Uncharacterized protein n=1 Tax=Blastopirellula retiformator TaxID=2527970 RepID=A0A5C5VLM8_9BACT|nr:hypothetical protein [Blastopirellula retiformator]TWT38755.1 hypothetical protein Enr8_04490 [Blastopirellula retiformator]
MLPSNADFLSSLQIMAIDAGPSVSLVEKQLLLALVRLYFGPAQESGAVQDVSSPDSLRHIGELIHAPNERFDQLERQTSLPDGFFARTSTEPVQPTFFVATQDNGEQPESFHIYERSRNLSIYVGPDFLHGQASKTVVNCLVLNETFLPTSSHTLRI